MSDLKLEPISGGHAEQELKMAYHSVIESGITCLCDAHPIVSVEPREAIRIYEKAYQAYQHGHRLEAEHWAQAAWHLANAFQHEAKIAYFESKMDPLPNERLCFEEDVGETCHDPKQSVTALEQWDPQCAQVLAETGEIPTLMRHYLKRKHRHLKILQQKGYCHEFLRIERVKVAYEYKCVLQCMTLAYEGANPYCDSDNIL